jgi:hypothetical protein
MNIIWSYSFISTYERCPLQASAKYVTKELPYVESPEAKYGNEVHKKLERYLIGNKVEFENKFMENVADIACNASAIAEMPLGVTRDWCACAFFNDAVWGRGKLDCTIIKDDQAIILDWKTGKKREDPFELEVQALLLYKHNPHLTSIYGSYVWLKEDEYGHCYDLYSTIGRTQDHIDSVLYEVGKEDWRAKKNPLCPWCTLKTCKFYKETRR